MKTPNPALHQECGRREFLGTTLTAQMRALEARTLPIVRQALYFRRWDLGA